MPPLAKVLLVDDHPVVRLGVRMVLEESGAFTVCGEAGTISAARQLVEALQPDFIVLDLVMGGRDGTELVEDLLAIHSAARILAYSSIDEKSHALRTVRAGARGYVMKSQKLDDIVAALETMARGDYALSPAIQRSLLDAVAGQRTGSDPLETLSNRELQVFHLLGSGKNTSEIGGELHLSMKTIGTYRVRLKSKLNYQTAQALEQCAVTYVQHGRLTQPGAL